MSLTKKRLLASAAVGLLFHTGGAMAAVSTGPGGSGVAAGNSGLIAAYHYTESWTIGATAPTAARQAYAAQAFPLPAGVPPLENTHGNPAVSWSATLGSIATDASNFPTAASPYPGSSGAGSSTGFTQTGTGGSADFGIAYGLSNNFILQADTLVANDRVNLFTGPTAGNFFTASSLAVFFRHSGTPNPQIGVFIPGVGEVNTGLSSGLLPTDQRRWHNFAVHFDLGAKTLDFYVDEALKGSYNYAAVLPVGYVVSNANLSIGSAGHGNRLWTDNFQVGGATPPPPPPMDHPNPGPMLNPPAGLISYWDFDEADGPEEGFTLNFAYDRVSGNHGRFQGAAGRTSGAGNGLINNGASSFDNSGGSTINVGPGVGNNFSTTTGITIEAMIVSHWSGLPGDYDEIFRKEDGNNRILFSFQNDTNSLGANPPVPNNTPVLSFGLNVAGTYSELDMPLDGTAGITLAELTDGNAHHVVATYDFATGEKTIWIDGAPRWSVNLGIGNPIISGGAADGHIGSSNGGENFNGLIDELAIWSRSLSDGEILDHYFRALNGDNYFPVIPEPASAGLLLIGAGMLALRRRNGR